MPTEITPPASGSRRWEKTRYPGVYRCGDRYFARWRDGQGKQHAKSARTLKQAREVRDTNSADVHRGEFRRESKATIGAYAKTWGETYQGRTQRGVRSATLADYKVNLSRCVEVIGSKVKLAEVTPQDVRKVANHFTGDGLSPRSVRNIIAPLRAMFATAVEEGLLKANPCSAVRLAGGGSAGKEPPRALSDNEWRSFIEKVPEPFRLIFRFCVETGVRVGELGEIKWGDIDLSAKRLKITRRVYRQEVGEPKSKFGLRVIPLSSSLVHALREHRLASRFAGDDDFIFTNNKGGRIDASNIAARVIKPAGVEAGLVDDKGKAWPSWHSFRHSCASILFRRGADVKQVQMILGHHSPSFTLSTYVHLLPDDLPNVDDLFATLNVADA